MSSKENSLIWEKYLAEKIATDHIKENPKYYTILKAKPKL